MAIPSTLPHLRLHLTTVNILVLDYDGCSERHCIQCHVVLVKRCKKHNPTSQSYHNYGVTPLFLRIRPQRPRSCPAYRFNSGDKAPFGWQRRIYEARAWPDFYCLLLPKANRLRKARHGSLRPSGRLRCLRRCLRRPPDGSHLRGSPQTTLALALSARSKLSRFLHRNSTSFFFSSVSILHPHHSLQQH